MNNTVLVIYWIIFCLCAILLQQGVSGVDALVPGMLIALQSRRKGLVVFLFVLFCLIQEGTGSLRFGTGVLWYAGVVALYFLGARIVMGSSFVAVLLLAGLFAGYLGVLSIFAYAIQDCTIDYQVLLRHCLIEAVLIPVIWLLAAPLRHRMIAHGTD